MLVYQLLSLICITCAAPRCRATYEKSVIVVMAKFDELDSDKSGMLDKEELLTAFANLGKNSEARIV